MGRRGKTVAKDLSFVIITGLSGAGKTQATRCFEDLGFFCIDNLPPLLIPAFARMLERTAPQMKNAAVVVDIRGGQFFDDLFQALRELEEEGYVYHILFLEASAQVLVQRFKEARRKHPLGGNGSMEQAIERERARLKEVKEQAHQVLNTSDMTIWDLKRKISQLFCKEHPEAITVQIISFGFKYGIPLDADVVLDVRFLPNPNYVPELQKLTGFDPKARRHVMSAESSKLFLAKAGDLLEFLIPQNAKEGKGTMVIAVGCTGGKHRSVVIAEELKRRLEKRVNVVVDHRDIERE